jgi:hypothetical protein
VTATERASRRLKKGRRIATATARRITWTVTTTATASRRLKKGRRIATATARRITWTVTRLKQVVRSR